MQPSFSPMARPIFGNPLSDRTVLSPPPPVPEAKAAPEGVSFATLRANLHAAARHAALGHVGPSFRECPGPACREAATLIPHLESLQAAATDAELDTILGEVLTSLEREGTFFFAPKPS